MNTTEPLNVLIAEDDALISQGIANQLLRLGFNPAGQAYDGPQAVELACQQHPGLVLMDLQMIDPETGREDAQAGLKAARAIQARCPMAVVVLTAHETPDLLRQATEAGVSGYLIKPAGDQDLARTMTIARARFDEILRLRGRAGELERHNDEIRAALARGNLLSGSLSFCAWCKKIRDERGLWQQLEVYLKAHLGMTLTHGVCPECYSRLRPDPRPGPANR
jgi:two-component system, response regulator PdtaR